MKTVRTGSTLFVALVAAVVTLCLLAVPAIAKAPQFVGGADFYGSISDRAPIDTLVISGDEGDVVYIDVAKDGNLIAKRYQYKLSDASSKAESAKRVGMVQLAIGTMNTSDMEGYHVNVYSDAAEKNLVYSGGMYPVYAQLGKDGQKKAMALRTLSDTGSEDARAFTPQSSYFDAQDQKYYRLSSLQPVVDGKIRTYLYEEYSPSSSVTGHITYVDDNGATLRTDEIAGIVEGQRTVPVANLFSVKDGANETFYRTLTAASSLTVTYPGQTEFVLHCKQATHSQPIGGDPEYLAVVNYVDGEGTVVLTDSVMVRKTVAYAAPREFYQADKDNFDLTTTYRLAADQSNQLVFDPTDSAGVVDGKKVVSLRYDKIAPGAAVNWTVIKMDGKTGQRMGLPIVISVEPGQTGKFNAVPETVDGVRYVPVGPANRTFEYNTQTNPVEYVYYVPEGYTPAQGYDVTVRYVNIANGSVLQSKTLAVSASQQEDLTINPGPEQLSVNGKTFVRLNGQTASFKHGYYSPYRSYTFYYRDINDTQHSNTVITRTRVVSDQDANVGLASDNAFDSAGQDGLKTSEGVDAATAYDIQDPDTPLAGGQAGKTAGSIPVGIWIAVGAVVLALLAAAGWFALRKRQDD